MKLVFEPGDLPFDPEDMLGVAYGFTAIVRKQGGSPPMAVVRFQGNGHTLEEDKVDVVVEKPAPAKQARKKTTRRRRSPAAA